MDASHDHTLTGYKGDSLVAKLERRLARVTFGKKIRMRNQVGVVSFSFDDLLQTACHAGRETLEQFDCQGTYYVCGGLTGLRRGGGQPYHTRDDLKLVLEQGHDLGCHGYAHLNYQACPIEVVRTDLERNREFFADLGCDLPPTHFAYPYGCVRPALKRFCGRRFTAARGVMGGINRRVSDLALLNAVTLYDSALSREEVQRLIERTEKTKGWLIFLTHGVSHDAGPFDCTPESLAFAVRTAVESGCRVLPVRHALGQIAFRSQEGTTR